MIEKLKSLQENENSVKWLTGCFGYNFSEKNGWEEKVSSEKFLLTLLFESAQPFLQKEESWRGTVLDVLGSA